MDKIYGMRYDYNFPFNISHVCEISIFFFSYYLMDGAGEWTFG